MCVCIAYEEEKEKTYHECTFAEKRQNFFSNLVGIQIVTCFEQYTTLLSLQIMSANKIERL